MNTTRELLLRRLLTSVSSRFGCWIRLPGRVGIVARGGPATREIRAAFHPAVRTRVLIKEAVSRRACFGAGKDASIGVGAQPNQRLKLTARPLANCASDSRLDRPRRSLGASR